jgi:hypothetical protein
VSSDTDDDLIIVTVQSATNDVNSRQYNRSFACPMGGGSGVCARTAHCVPEIPHHYHLNTSSRPNVLALHDLRTLSIVRWGGCLRH